MNSAPILAFIVILQVIAYGAAWYRFTTGKSCITDSGKSGTCILVKDCPDAIESLRAGGSPKPCGFEGVIPKVCCANLARLRESLPEKSKSCTTDSGKSGTCILVKDCPEAIKLLRAGGIPTQCGFEGDIPKVCCANLARLRESLPEKSNSCTTDSGKRGTCILVQNCQEAIKSLRAGGSPKPCGFEGDIPKVCCPNLSRLRESLANKKCLEYRIKAMTTPSKRRHDVQMYNGKPALPLEFPHMAVLGYGKKYANRLCGGSLISENFVLTAAHCLNGNVTNVKLGMHQFSMWTNYVQEFRVKKIYPHPDYLTSRLYHDIGLIELDRPAYIDAEGVKPACLHTSKDIPTNSFIGTGWGITEWLGETSDVLQKVYLSYVAYENCAGYYNWQIRLPNGLEDASQFCADGGGTGADTCEGDSGGPLQVPLDEGMYTIIGITSFGIKCAAVPGVYTRVSYYVPWIESIVWAKAADIL